MKRQFINPVAIALSLFCCSAFGQTTLRIEDAATFTTGYCAADGSRQNSYTGASNGYYVNLSNSSGKGINWKVSVPSAGSYSLKWRYANAGSSSATSARVLVNGTSVISSVAFPKTSTWSTWTLTSGSTVNLSAGVNTVRLETTVSSEFANIDWIEVTGNGPAAASCSGTTTTYSLTTSSSPSSGGSVSPPSGSYEAGSSVTVTATPASGYKFDGWSGSVTGTTNPLTITMNSNQTLTANFSLTSTTSSYTLTTTTSGSGTISRNPDASSYAAGTSVALTATPASGYVFSGWSGSVSGTANPISITMDANKSVTATFTQSNTPPPSSNMIGYATLNGGTTGGQNGTSTTVSTLAELQAWALGREGNTTPAILYINGKISASSTTVVTIKHGANVSVYGINGTSELQNVGLNFRNYKNVIVQNIKIHEVLYPNDALTIDQCENVWVDHCELYSQIGAGIGVDTYDGLLDIKNGSRYVTVSWCHLHHHMKNMLFGHTDNSSQQAIDVEFRITLHHNYIENTSGRNPSLRWGAVHMFNNYLKDVSDYGIAVRQGAHALIENNVFHNVKLPITTNKFTGEGFACERGNIFSGTSGANSITQTGCDWWTSSTLPYSYSLEAASNVSTSVPAGAGVQNTTSSTSSIQSDSFLSLQHNDDAFYIRNYPNPMDHSTTFDFSVKTPGSVKITLFNSVGDKMDVITNQSYPAGRTELKYINSKLTPGVYIYLMETAEGNKSQKLVVQ